MPTTCPFCHFQIIDPEHSYFCPNCGKKLKEPPLTLFKQIGIYLVSIFLPPLGLWPGIKYLLQSDEKKKMVGLIAIVLTLLSTVITIWLTIGFVNNLNQGVNTQLQQYQNLTQ